MMYLCYRSLSPESPDQPEAKHGRLYPISAICLGYICPTLAGGMSADKRSRVVDIACLVVE